MNIYRTESAPLTNEAWKEVEQVVRQTVATRSTARRVVDVEGPRGFECSAINLGRLDSPQEARGVNFAMRKVQPLLELRAPFELSIWELDNIARGADDVDLDAAVQSALKVVDFEEHAIYEGLEAAGISGLTSCNAHKPHNLKIAASELPQTIANAVQELVSAGVAGPYALVLPLERYAALAADASVYPPKKRVEALLQGGPVLGAGSTSSYGFLISLRGGDLRLTLGQDLAIGHDYHDAKSVKLYLSESFTFQVLAPEAVVVLEG